MIVKGLPETQTEEILKEMKLKRLNPTSCSLIRRNYALPDGISRPAMYRVNFPPGISPNEVTKCNHLFSVRVYWEKFLSNKRHTQCFRCQAFGHSASNCNLPPICVKCAGKHLSANLSFYRGERE